MSVVATTSGGCLLGLVDELMHAAEHRFMRGDRRHVDQLALNADQKLLAKQLNLDLPPQPLPRITDARQPASAKSKT
jgi:hypothetical protein